MNGRDWQLEKETEMAMLEERSVAAEKNNEKILKGEELMNENWEKVKKETAAALWNVKKRQSLERLRSRYKFNKKKET